MRKVRFSHIQYYLAYAIELILYSIKSRFVPIGASIFGISGSTIAYAFHMIASLVAMLLWSDHFKPIIHVSVITLVAGFISFNFFTSEKLGFVFAVMIYAGLGGVVTSCRCGFAFASNNSERLFGMVVMYFSVIILKLLRALELNGALFSLIIPAFLIAGLAFLLLKYREEDFEVKTEAHAEDVKGLYWAFAYFIIYFTLDGYINGLVSRSHVVEYRFFLVGNIIGGAILILTIKNLRLNPWHSWNLFLAFSLIMAFFAVLGLEKIQYFFGGLSILGWPLAIYILGCAQRRFASYRILKRCTLYFVLISPLTTLSDDIFEDLLPQYLPMITLVIVVVVIFLLFVFSPHSYRHLFSAAWLDEIHDEDMRLIHENVKKTDRFNGWGLTHRQREVATYLLAAKTRRQISAELGVSESTVKTHTSDLYRKLGINSRVELFRIFGVAELPETPEEI